MPLSHHTLSANDGVIDNAPPMLRDVVVYRDYAEFQKACLAQAVIGGLHMEFGVAEGNSFRFLRSIIPDDVKLFGFDSFEGLPEAWNNNPKHYFACSPPTPPPNSVIVQGLFEDTLPKFAQEHAAEYVSFAHIDCDLYSSTKCVLDTFKSQIAPGTVLVFDEFFGYHGWEEHEAKAFNEFIAETGFKFEFVARDVWFRLGIRIIE